MPNTANSSGFSLELCSINHEIGVGVHASSSIDTILLRKVLELIINGSHAKALNSRWSLRSISVSWTQHNLAFSHLLWFLHTSIHRIRPTTMWRSFFWILTEHSTRLIISRLITFTILMWWFLSWCLLHTLHFFYILYFCIILYPLNFELLNV